MFFSKKREVSKIIERYNRQNRLESLKDYLTFLKIGMEDGWIKTNNKKLKTVYHMLDNMSRFYKR